MSADRARILSLAFGELTRIQLKHFIESNRYEYPCVVGQTVDGRFHMLFADSEVPDYAHQPGKFVKTLQTRAIQAGMAWSVAEVTPSAMPHS